MVSRARAPDGDRLMRPVAFYGLGKLGLPIHARVSAAFETFHSADRHDYRALADSSGNSCSLASLDRPTVLLCLPPQLAPALASSLLHTLDRGSTLVDLGNTDPHDTDQLASIASALGVEYYGVGVASGPDLAADRCSLTVGEPTPGAADDLDALLDAISGNGGRHQVVGPPFAGHLAKVLLNPAGYLCTYAVAGSCRLLLQQGVGFRGIADRLQTWCDSGHDSYLARVAISCLRGDHIEQELEAIESTRVPHSGVGVQWMRLMAECGILPMATAAGVSARLESSSLIAWPNSNEPVVAGADGALRIYESVYTVAVLELAASIESVGDHRHLPSFERCLDAWDSASLLSGEIYSSALQAREKTEAVVLGVDLAYALDASGPLIALMRRGFGGHAVNPGGG